MKLTASYNETFVPKFNKNRDLPADKKVTVKVRALTAQDRTAYCWHDSDPTTNRISTHYDTTRLVRAHVVSIDNLEGPEGKIETGEDLLKCTDPWAWGLIGEIRRYLYSDGIEEEESEGN